MGRNRQFYAMLIPQSHRIAQFLCKNRSEYMRRIFGTWNLVALALTFDFLIPKHIETNTVSSLYIKSPDLILFW